MKKLICLFYLLAQGCASSQIAKDFRMISLEEKPTELKSIGPVEGKDCTWSAFGYRIGDEPNVANAFNSAAEQKEQSLVPGEKAKVHGTGLKAIKNISVENSGFGIWVVGRSCIVVKGAGYQ